MWQKYISQLHRRRWTSGWLTSTADGARTRNHATFQLIRVVACPSSLREILPSTNQTEEVLCCLAFHFGRRGAQDVLRRRRRWSSRVLSVRSFGGFFELKMGLGCQSGRKQWAIFCQRVGVRGGQKSPGEDSSRGSQFTLLIAVNLAEVCLSQAGEWEFFKNMFVNPPESWFQK